MSLFYAAPGLKPAPALDTRPGDLIVVDAPNWRAAVRRYDGINLWGEGGIIYGPDSLTEAHRRRHHPGRLLAIDGTVIHDRRP